MLSQVRTLGFGPMQLRISGALCALPWPEGARQLESAAADGIEIATELVASLPGVASVRADGRVWQSEITDDGERVVILARRDLVIADLMRVGAGWRLRCVQDQMPARVPAWFDVAVQLVASTMAPVFGGALMHAACVELSGRAVLLAGTSGVGKTTLSRRLIAHGASALSHDRTLVFPGWSAVATPWGHDGRLAGARVSAPLAAVFMLEQGLTNASAALHGAAGVMRVAASMVGGWVAAPLLGETLGAVARLVAGVPCFATSLTNDDKAAQHVMELLA